MTESLPGPYDDVYGPKAIVALQDAVGIEEPLEKATANWAKFSYHDKLQTTLAHKAVCKGFDDTKLGSKVRKL